MVSHQTLSSLYSLSSFAPIAMASHPFSTFSLSIPSSLLSFIFHNYSVATTSPFYSLFQLSCLSSLSSLVATTMVLCPF
ncbi:unnamed protein product, partial [Sphagnum jensenii]